MQVRPPVLFTFCHRCGGWGGGMVSHNNFVIIEPFSLYFILLHGIPHTFLICFEVIYVSYVCLKVPKSPLSFWILFNMNSI